MTTLQLATSSRRAPASQLDPYSEGALTSPWETYEALQSLGPAVWLLKHEMFALSVSISSTSCET
jgi:hypothetical protein